MGGFSVQVVEVQGGCSITEFVRAFREFSQVRGLRHTSQKGFVGNVLVLFLVLVPLRVQGCLSLL